MQQSKIDNVINKIIDGVRGKGRGFVLDLAAGPCEVKADVLIEAVQQLKPDEALTQERIERLRELAFAGTAPGYTAVEVRESLPPIDEYIRPTPHRKHILHDTDAFIAFAKRYGDAKRSLVLYDQNVVTLTIDELMTEEKQGQTADASLIDEARGDREVITMPFVKSEDWTRWSEIIGEYKGHKELVKFLINNNHNLESPELLHSMRVFRANTVVNQDSDVTEDNRTISFLVKTNAEESMAKFPKAIKLKIPILAADVADSDSWAVIELRIEVELPDHPGKPVLFCLSCSQWDQHFINRIDHEGDVIREALKDWTVLHGTHQQTERRIGRPGGK